MDRAVRAARSALDGPRGRADGDGPWQARPAAGSSWPGTTSSRCGGDQLTTQAVAARWSGGVRSLPDWYDYYGGSPDKIEGTTLAGHQAVDLRSHRPEPVVVGAIAPWNSPLLITTLKRLALAATTRWSSPASYHPGVDTGARAAGRRGRASSRRGQRRHR
ncbi:aldehyde dehydrogenase family protein [Pseudonocardia sp. MCCB 268]|nr:aldehyde dehydrogenase family protein [Pseudonocardia cytotoxica]